MNRNEKINLIAQDLPMIREIQDPVLAEQVADVWLRTLEVSTWDRIADMPFKDGSPGRTLKEHVNACTEAALAVSRIFQRHHGLTVNEDFLVAFALIHDVDKALKYANDGQGALLSPKREKDSARGDERDDCPRLRISYGDASPVADSYSLSKNGTGVSRGNPVPVY